MEQVMASKAEEREKLIKDLQWICNPRQEQTEERVETNEELVPKLQFLTEETVPPLFLEVAAGQAIDHEIQGMVNESIKHPYEIIARDIQGTDLAIIGDISSNCFRPIIPKNLRKKVFEDIHGRTHAGRNQTLSLMAEYCIWPGMSAFVRDSVRQCRVCAMYKGTVYEKRTHQMASYPTGRFRTLATDFCGPFPNIQGYKYVLVVIDRATRKFAAAACKSQTAEEAMRTLWAHWFRHYGIPDMICSDGGPAFKADHFRSHMKSLGIKHMITLAYESRLNGIAENLVKRVKMGLKPQESPDQWLAKLPLVNLTIQNLTGSDGVSPNMVTFGQQVRLPNTLFEKEPETKDNKHLRLLQDFASDFSTRVFRFPVDLPEHTNKALKIAKEVFIKDMTGKKGLHKKWLGPFPLVSINGLNATIIRRGKKVHVTVTRLKPCFENLDMAHTKREQLVQTIDDKVLSELTIDTEGTSEKHPPSEEAERFVSNDVHQVHFQETPPKAQDDPAEPFTKVHGRNNQTHAGETQVRRMGLRSAQKRNGIKS